MEQVISNPEIARTVLDDYIVSVGWLPDGQRLCVADSSGLVQVLDVAQNTCAAEWEAHDGLLVMAHSPVANLAVTGGQDGSFKLWDTAQAKLLEAYPVRAAWTEHAVWSPDGRYCAVATGRQVVLIEANGYLCYRSAPHESTVSGITWHPGSQKFATACFGGVRIFNIEEPEATSFMPWKNSMISISWSPDGKFIGCGTQDSRVHFFPMPYVEGDDFEMSGYKGKVRLLEWDSRARYFLTNCWDEVVIWHFEGKAPTGQVPWTLREHQQKITAMRYQHSGDVFATADTRGALFFYRANADELSFFAGYNAGVEITCLAWSPDDQHLAFGAATGEVLVMKAPSVTG
jgi:WD40 repeat protein